jgi:hypothetical protein
VKSLFFPSWFFILDGIYSNTDLFLGVNYNIPFNVRRLSVYLCNRKEVTSYSYVHRVVMLLVEYKYLQIEKEGRDCFIYLTKKGIRLSERIHFIIEELRYKQGQY